MSNCSGMRWFRSSKWNGRATIDDSRKRRGEREKEERKKEPTAPVCTIRILFSLVVYISSRKNIYGLNFYIGVKADVVEEIGKGRRENEKKRK